MNLARYLARARALLLFLVVMASGCSSLLTDAIVATNSSHAFLVSANAELAALHRRARDLAIERAGTELEARRAVVLVHQRFAPAWEAYDRARVAWLAAAATCRAALAAEAAKREPDLPRVTQALAALVEAFGAFERAAVALGTSPPPRSAFGGGGGSEVFP